MEALGEQNLDRKAMLITRLLTRVAEYHAVKGRGCPKAVLVRALSTALKPFGGLDAVLDELRFEGAIEIALTDGGGYRIYPSGEVSRLPLGETLIG